MTLMATLTRPLRCTRVTSLPSDRVTNLESKNSGYAPAIQLRNCCSIDDDCMWAVACNGRKIVHMGIGQKLNKGYLQGHEKVCHDHVNTHRMCATCEAQVHQCGMVVGS